MPSPCISILVSSLKRGLIFPPVLPPSRFGTAFWLHPNAKMITRRHRPACLLERGFRPGMGGKKRRRNIGFGLPSNWKNRKTKKGEWPPNPILGQFFRFFGIFWERPKPIFSLFFPYFAPDTYRPIGRKSRPLIPLSFFWNLVLQCLSVCSVWPTRLQKTHVSLISKQIVFWKALQTHTKTFFNPNRQRPSHALVLPPRTTWLGPLLTPHQHNRQVPVASFCKDGEHRVWRRPVACPLVYPLTCPLARPVACPLAS